jgi:hypothetical protein
MANLSPKYYKFINTVKTCGNVSEKLLQPESKLIEFFTINSIFFKLITIILLVKLK